MRLAPTIAAALLLADCAHAQVGVNAFSMFTRMEDYGLVSRWCPSATGNALDMVGVNHGSLSNGAGIAADGFSFDGNGWVEVGNRANLSNTNGAFTLSAWAKYSSNGSGGIFSKGQYNVNSEWMLYANLSGVGMVEGTLNTVSTTYRQKNIPSAITSNTWRHYAVTWDGNTNIPLSPGEATGLNLYVDGRKATNYVSEGNFWNFLTNGGGKVVIGALNNGAAYRMPNGSRIDDVRFYNRELKQAEVQALQARGRP